MQAEKKKEYMNEWQVTLFDFMHSLPMKDELKDELHKVVLASEINDARDFVRAKDVLLNIIRDINEGILTISTTLRAVFKGAQSKVVERRSNMKGYIICGGQGFKCTSSAFLLLARCDTLDYKCVKHEMSELQNIQVVTTDTMIDGMKTFMLS
ncbi:MULTISPECIES: hypothetical protein [Sporosarcina]|uniref:hypothetical protein n=1 Tax=Sporosarcina TaxID=1569 RepID=UPI00078CD682|nr:MULTISPECIES: hypothetical protein [Sporosarcina]AMQ06521.1 hypothetical protein AZE41_11610 [Sporosarcina psychrophila]